VITGHPPRDRWADVVRSSCSGRWGSRAICLTRAGWCQWYSLGRCWARARCGTI